MPSPLDVVRYVGEPVAVVIAEDRYRAEDAAELVIVDYDPLDTVVDPLDGDLAPGMRRCSTTAVGSNVVSDRSFRLRRSRRPPSSRRIPPGIALDIAYPRNACTPIEGLRRAGRSTWPVTAPMTCCRTSRDRSACTP